MIMINPFCWHNKYDWLKFQGSHWLCAWATLAQAVVTIASLGFFMPSWHTRAHCWAADLEE